MQSIDKMKKTWKVLLCGDIILRVFLFQQFCNVMNGCLMWTAYVPPFCFWILEQKYMSKTKVI